MGETSSVETRGLSCTPGLTWPGKDVLANDALVHCSKIAEAEAVVSVNEKNWLVMHMHVQMRLDELQGPPNSFTLC